MLIPVEQLIQKFNITIKGVLHLGAHQAEEAPQYAKAAAKHVVWVEGNPELMPVLNEELKKYPGQVAYNVLVSDRDGDEVEFKIANNFQSSSILELGTHKDHHPEISVHHTLKLKTHRLDHYFEKNNVSLDDCNFLNIDLQGAELMALKGLGERLNVIDYIYTEINVGEVYVGCATLYQLDTFLAAKGFHRVALELTKWQWGDAFYMRQQASKMSVFANQSGALFYQVKYNLSSWGKRWYQRLRWLPGKVLRKLRPPVVVDVNPAENGEAYFMETHIHNHVARPVIFDVGANLGEYTAMALNVLAKKGINDYELHLFEPQTTCLEKLRARFDNNKNIRINPFGLSDSNGEAEIHFDFSGSSSASMYDRKEVQLDQKTTIQLRRLEDYMIENNVKRIDLLKIDTEGNEKRVLTGGGDQLNPEMIKAVQFEYGGTYLDAGITLAEIAQMMMNKNYRVGKLESRGIAFQDHLGDFKEDYQYANYVAISHEVSEK